MTTSTPMTTSNTSISTRLWSDKAKTLSPYVPGEQPKHDNLCKLNTNENPFPPSPKVAEAIGQVLANQATALRLYPEPESDNLRQTLAETYGVQAEQVFVGNGSDEVLALVFACFFMHDKSANKPLLTPDISYSFYPVYAQTFDVEVKNIPLQEDFSVNVEDYCQENDINQTGGIIIANPNAPTGLLLSLADISKLCETHQNAVVVIDEAYIDFTVVNGESGLKVGSAVNLIDKYDNLLVTQTFSKSRALAGLRVGMAFANSSLIEALTRMKNSFNSYPLDRLAQAGAVASLQDSSYFSHVCQQVIELRHELMIELRHLGFEVLDSQANFVFAKPPRSLEEGNAERIASLLREQGIIVRYFNKPRISEYLRISVGTHEQNQRLINELKALAGQEEPMSTNQPQSSNKRDDLRFFLKCYNTETGKNKTYRFDNQDDLANFAKQANQQKLTIIDTHITFFDVELLFAPISEEDAVITAMDIDMAEDGIYYLEEWDKQ